MSLSQEEWHDIGRLEGGALKERVFSMLQQVAGEIQEREPDDPQVLGVVPRLAALIEARSELASFKEAFNALARAVGLWNYIDRESADVRDQILTEAVSVPELDGLTLHREQVEALNALLAGRNLILSAPTSFGKSVLIDALIASGKYSRVAIVLPTIALLDEFRRRLTVRFGNRFRVLMHHSEQAPEGNVIFLGTQERLINRTDLGRLDLVVVDEFYKLDPARRDDRSLTLNAAVYQLLRLSNQFFFLGPNIENVRFSPGSRWRFEFLRTRFSTVAVDTLDLRQVADKGARLEEEVKSESNWPALIFVSAPDRANRLASELSGRVRVGRGAAIAGWISENYGAGWPLIEAVSAGIGVHHGRIPRAVASQFIRSFNRLELPILICTSTLIEGVNTAAKSVLIYDKAINRADYDFFTFSNIRGRAGRQGQHYVGYVYLFHTPPEHENIEVTPPLFGDLEDAPDELVIQISDEDTTPAITDRIRSIAEALNLSPSELRLASSVGLEVASALRDWTNSTSGARIHWSGYPGWSELLAVCNIICKVKNPNEFGAHTARQLAWLLGNLREQSRMKQFFASYASNYRGQPSGWDNIFKFLRACEYGLPQLFSVVELFAKRQDETTDYSLFTAEMSRWFRPEILKNLEEEGIPIQISERFWIAGDSMESLLSRLRTAALDSEGGLSEFEREWVSAAIPQPT
jgi:hypothetical protein